MARFAAIARVLMALVLVLLACGAGWAQCTPEWARGMFPVSGISGIVSALCVYNGELYAGGGGTAGFVAKWNGTSWQPVGNGMTGGGKPSVGCMCVYKDELYVGGVFTIAGGVTANNIAKWDGTSWQPVGTGLMGGIRSSVDALCVYNDEIYAGGHFSTVGGVAANSIAKWNGTSWQAVDTGMMVDSFVRALCVYNGELYAGGHFSTAGGVSASRIARWNGTSWQPVGTGIGEGYPVVGALCVCNGELYVGGVFSTAGGVSANDIAKWNGTSWQAVGTGVNGWVYALCEYDDGLGPEPALYAGGVFTTAGGNVSSRIARWGCETALADVASAKKAADGRLVSIAADVSTAVFGDAFYMSHLGYLTRVGSGIQVSGMRAEMVGHGVTRDKLTSVTGRTRTSADGERYIDAWSANCGASASAKPLAMPLASLGGGPFGQQGGVSGWVWSPQKHWGQVAGLNNMGMLVRVWGKVTYIDARNFTLDDGSGIAVHCVTQSDVTVDPLWQYVSVTGISSCEASGTELHRKALVRSAGDVDVVL